MRKIFMDIIRMILICILIFSETVFVFMGNSGVSTNNHWITGKQAHKIGYTHAKKWNENVVLVGMRAGGKMLEEGHFKHWYVVYAKPAAIGNNTECIEFKVFYNGTTVEIPRSKGLFWGGIGNWSLDSDEAYEIGKKYNEIKKWLSKYDDAKLERISFGHNHLHNEKLTWGISWVSMGNDDPHYAHITIDAVTGEVLEVETEVEDRETRTTNSYISLIIIFILIVLLVGLIIYTMRRKQKRQSEKEK